MALVKVVDYNNLRKDTKTNAVINTNQEDYLEWKKKRQEILDDIEKKKRQEEDINTMKQDIRELKSLVYTLIGEIKNACKQQ